jgi:hypothetical protein
VARVVMNMWDSMWLKSMTFNNISVITVDGGCGRGNYVSVRSENKRTLRMEKVLQRGRLRS